MIIDLTDVPEVERVMQLQPGAKYVVIAPTLPRSQGVLLGEYLKAKGIDAVVIYGTTGLRFMKIADATAGIDVGTNGGNDAVPS